MRLELLPPDDDDGLADLVVSAYRQLESGDAPVVVADQLSAESGQRVTAEWLHGAFGSVGPAEAAWQLRVIGDAGLVRRVAPTRDELIEIVGRLQESDARTPWWEALLCAHVSHPAPVDLIFHPPADVDPGTWDAAAIVDRALAHRAIEL